MNTKIDLKKTLTIATITFLVFTIGGTILATTQLGEKGADITLSNEQIKIVYTDEAVAITEYTDDRVEPQGWELFPSLYWDANGNEVFDDNEQMASTLFPMVHFTENAQSYTFCPLHQSLKDLDDADIISSGWINEPHEYASEVQDTNDLIKIQSVICIYNGNNYFTQTLNVTSTASSTLSNVDLIVYLGMEIQGFFDNYAFIDANNNNMIKAKDNTAEVWFGAYPTFPAESYEISSWNDGPSKADDLWQHCLFNTLTDQSECLGDCEGALLFNLTDLAPGETKSITLYYSFANNEDDLYPSSPPPLIVYVDDDYDETTPGWQIDHFDVIQDGIDVVADEGVVQVSSGTYPEHVTIDKTITLRGEQKDITIIDGGATGNVVTVTADRVNVSGFTITNGDFSGIYLNHVDHVKVNDTILISHENGMYLDGCQYTLITAINASYNNDDGIEITGQSQHTLVQYCTFIHDGASVFINDATHNIIDHNFVTDCTAFGIQLYNQANDNIISNNTIINTTDETYPDISGHGINIWEQGNTNQIIGNTLVENILGIYIRESSTANEVYHNTFFENTQNAYDACITSWDNGYPSGGNYWDDYTGVDFKHGPDQTIWGADDIGDSNYSIPGGSNVDQYPLMLPPGVFEFILDLNDFPMYQAESDPGYHEMCGPAVAKMTLDYIWWNSTQDPEGPVDLYSQAELYQAGLENNTNQTTPYLDTQGLWKIIQYNKPMPYTEYGYNFMKYSNDNLTEMLKRICLWVNYTIGTVGGYKPGHPLHVPAIVPAYGDYTNWMAIRGIHTDKAAYPIQHDLTIHGFWVNDPYPGSLGGLGENSYKTIAQWIHTYYHILETDDYYNNKYVAIFEPPETTEFDMNIGQTNDQFTPWQQHIMNSVNKNPSLQRLLQRTLDHWVIQAAQEGVAEHLLPYDDQFASVFATTTPGSPYLIHSESGDDYYAVPFNVPQKKPLDKTTPMSSVRSKATTQCVILIDAEDGSFKEASWVQTPVKYLPLNREDVLEMIPDILEEHGLELEDTTTVTLDLVHRQGTPYYPEWKVFVKAYDWCVYISQQGTQECGV